MEIIFLLCGILAGAGIAALFISRKSSLALKVAEEKFIAAERQAGVLNERVSLLSANESRLQTKLDEEVKNSSALQSALTSEKSETVHLREKLATQKAEMEDIHKLFTEKFENLSAKILEEKSKKFTEQNRDNLDIILKPFKEKIAEFEKKVDETYKAEAGERNSLRGEIKTLAELHKQMSEDANNLTRALKGDTKQQGNWGELILEKILERSGLTPGEEYETQQTASNEEGSRIRPDVIVNLPGNKHIIIDSKVSLVAYEAFVNATTEEEREKHLKDHVASVRSHIKLLSDKHYYSSRDLNALEYVLMFMPVEPSFGLAVRQDQELFNFAWEKKIVLVSPSTLLATLKTIGSIWKQERQTKNAIEIARQGGALYDKFVGFLNDLKDVGDKMDAARKAHQNAMSKLSEGHGNIIRKVEDLKKLGARTTKEIPLAQLEQAHEGDA